MALLTLRKINAHLDFVESSQVKITRRAVKATVLTSRFARGHDALLRAIFFVAGRGLPDADPALARLSSKEDRTENQSL
jgi:farnesyl-diphosphate farnesyltransferase